MLQKFTMQYLCIFFFANSWLISKIQFTSSLGYYCTNSSWRRRGLKRVPCSDLDELIQRALLSTWVRTSVNHMHKSSVRFGSAKKIGGSVRFGFGKKFLVRSFPTTSATLANWPAFTKCWKSFEIVTRHVTCMKTSFITFRFSHRWIASANPRCYRCYISVPYPHVKCPSGSPFSPPQYLTQNFKLISRFTWLYTQVLSKWSKLKSSTYSVGEGLFIFSCGYL